jgi:hypothetical protein
MKPSCGTTAALPDVNVSMLNQVVCDSQFLGTPCLPGSSYPKSTGVVMHPLPSGLETMAHPCSGAPANAWCPRRKR